MRKSVLCASVLALGAAFLAHGQSASVPTKVGIIRIQDAIIGTKDGQQAASELQTKFAPRKQELEKAQSEIAGLRDRMQKGANTMTDDQKSQLSREIDSKTRALNRQTEDAQAEFDQQQQKVLQDLGQRIMAVINKYAQDNGFAVILDASGANTPILYAANSVDITDAVVGLYNKNAPGAAAGAPGNAVTPRAVTPQPPAPAKKQPGAPK